METTLPLPPRIASPKTAKLPRQLKGGLGGTPSGPLIQARPSSNKIQKPVKPLRRLADVKPRQLVALDTETTGTDFWHGCRAFFVSTLLPDGQLQSWEWDVNPYTRDVGFYAHPDLDPKGRFQNSPYGKQTFIPLIRPSDKDALTSLVQDNDLLLHNTKFDVRALEHHGIPLPNWGTLHDTLIASHVLCSNESHKLKDLALQYLDIRDDDQSALRDATNHARRIARSLSKKGALWQIAESPESGEPQHAHFPAQRDAPKDGWWVYDTWLPRAVAKYMWEVVGNPDYAPPVSTAISEELGTDAKGHPWWTVLSTYALRDVERTYGLWLMFKDDLEEQGLWNFYETKRQNLEAVYTMESDAVTLSPRKIREQREQRAKDNAACLRECILIGKGKVDESTLRSTKQLQGFIMGTLGVKLTKTNKTGYSLDKDVKRALYDRTHPKPGEKPTPAHRFIKNLILFGKTEKNDSYLEEYTLRSLPFQKALLLHGSFNPTGTDTTRLSSSGPNLQNISKQVDPIFGDFNLRRCFVPLPGREIYSIDYSNIEMRIFSYESGDQQLIESFEQGYSVHCIFAEILFYKEFNACKREARGDRKQTEKLFKSIYESTLYTWVKNGNFALIYGAGVEKANTTYHHPDGYNLIRTHLPLVDEFLALKNHEAKTYGFIRTLGAGKDHTKRPQGYKLFVPPNEPHVAVNYFVQGSAGWCMVLAINRVHHYLTRLNAQLGLTGRDRYLITMTIHDELDFDFPIHERNHQVISDIAHIMEQSGDDIGLPTPVEVERHTQSWAEGESVNVCS